MASKLHDGSRWDGDTVVEGDGTRLQVYTCLDANVLQTVQQKHLTRSHVSNALAAIRSANLDPLAIAARELVNHLDAIETHHWSGDDETDAVDMDSAESRTDELLLRIRELLS
jgi:hypothetical protein